MAALTSIAAAIAAAATLAGTVKGFTSSKSKTPTITPPSVPPGPAADLTKEGILGQRPGSAPAAPNFLSFSPDMTNLQKRAAIATFGSQGNDGKYADSATKDYYKNLLLSDYGDKGLAGGALPVEYQYATNVLGVKPRENTAESLISAILRG